MRTRTPRALLSALLLAALAGPALAGETPPEGPPWVRDLVEAQRAAVKQGVPIFVYFTKTY